MGSHSLLQGIFPAQGLRTPVYLHCRQILSCLNHQGSPRRLAFKSLAHRLPLPRAWCRGSPLKSPQTFCERDPLADPKASAYRDESHSLSGRGWRCWQAPLTCSSSPSLKSVGYNCFLLSSHPRPPKATPLHQYSTLGCPWLPSAQRSRGRNAIFVSSLCLAPACQYPPEMSLYLRPGFYTVVQQTPSGCLALLASWACAGIPQHCIHFTVKYWHALKMLAEGLRSSQLKSRCWLRLPATL